MNAVEREPVSTRVINPNASEVSYEAKKNPAIVRHRVLAPDSPGAQMSSAQTAAPKRTRPSERNNHCNHDTLIVFLGVFMLLRISSYNISCK